jgi:hypothetical protein
MRAANPHKTRLADAGVRLYYMNKYWTLNGKQLLMVILYTAIFPIANLIQGKIGEVLLFFECTFFTSCLDGWYVYDICF